MYKKIITLSLVVVASLAMNGCGGSDTTPEEDTLTVKSVELK